MSILFVFIVWYKNVKFERTNLGYLKKRGPKSPISIQGNLEKSTIEPVHMGD